MQRDFNCQQLQEEVPLVGKDTGRHLLSYRLCAAVAVKEGAREEPDLV